MKKMTYAAALLLGINAILIQVMLIRELLVSFSGNELSIGIIFAIWFIGGAMGSLIIAKKLVGRIKKSTSFLIAGFSIITVAAPLSLFLSRTLKALFHIPVYEVIGPLHILIISALVLVPISSLLGICFIICYKMIESLDGLKNRSGIIYILEAIGATAAGALFTFVLVKYLNPFQIVYGLVILNLFYLVWVSKQSDKRLPVFALILILALLIFKFDAIGRLEKKSQNIQWMGQSVVAYTNSLYGNITVTESSNTTNLYENGSLFLSTEDEAFNEELIHLIMLQHHKPRDLLLIGGGIGGALGQILKHNPAKVTYLQLDPLIIDIGKKFISTADKAALDDPRVEIVHEDARFFIKNTKEKFDIIITNLPDPTTLQLNRLYSYQFYLDTKRHLKEGGIFSTSISSKESIISDELAKYNGSVYKTLKSVYKSVTPIPGEGLILIASDDTQINKGRPDILIKRFNQRKIRSRFLTAYHIKDRHYPNKFEYFKKRIASQYSKIKLNSDFHPISLYYNITLWAALSHPYLMRFFDILENIHSIYIIIAMILLFALLYQVINTRKDPIAAATPIAIGIGGAVAIMLEMIIILSFQISYGYVYAKVGFLISLFMLGLALGAYIINRFISSTTNLLRLLLSIILAFSVYILSMPLIINGLTYLPFKAAQFFFYPMIFLAGLAIGSQFPIGVAILEKKSSLDQAAATIWGADLLGACFGTVASTLILIPLLGIFQTLFICFLLCAGAFGIILVAHRRLLL